MQKLTTKKTNNKGITLIAIVITIILMLILLGVTVNVALEGDLFGTAKNATNQTQMLMEKEKLLEKVLISMETNGKVDFTKLDANIQEEGIFTGSNGRYKSETGVTYLVDEYGDVSLRANIPLEIKVGDYVNYTPDTGTYKVADGEKGTGVTTDLGYQEFTTQTGTTALKWRILSIDEKTGKIELVSESSTSASLSLRSANGYNHGVDILNDLCSTLYSKTVNGEIVAQARSMNVEDINAKTTNHNQNNPYYGQTFTKNNVNYPQIYKQEKGSTINGVTGTSNLLSGSDGIGDGVVNSNSITEYSTYIGVEPASTLSAVDTKYSYKYSENLLDLGPNTAPVDLFYWIAIGEHWLASRCMDSAGQNVNFSIQKSGHSSCTVLASPLYYSYGRESTYTYKIRPVIELSTDTSFSIDSENTTNTVTYWNIEF